MKVEILEAAEVELSEAIEYYEDLEPGLGIRLKGEIWERISCVVEGPER